MYRHAFQINSCFTRLPNYLILTHNIQSNFIGNAFSDVIVGSTQINPGVGLVQRDDLQGLIQLDPVPRLRAIDLRHKGNWNFGFRLQKKTFLTWILSLLHLILGLGFPTTAQFKMAWSPMRPDTFGLNASKSTVGGWTRI